MLYDVVISSVTMVWLWDKMKIENISSSSQDNDDLDQQEHGASFTESLRMRLLLVMMEN